MGQFSNGKRPCDRAIKEAVNFFESIGLAVYGSNIDFKTGELKSGLIDYSACDVVKLRDLDENDLIHEKGTK